MIPTLGILNHAELEPKAARRSRGKEGRKPKIWAELMWLFVTRTFACIPRSRACSSTSIKAVPPLDRRFPARKAHT